MKTPIIILHRYHYGDTSWVVKGLSPDVGVLSLLVKGAKSKNSPFKAGIDPLAHSEVELRYKGDEKLHLPKEICLQNYFPKMRLRLSDLATAQFFAEILLRIGGGGQHAAEEFEWLLGIMNILEKKGADKNSVSVWLQKLCSILGYAPLLSQCGQCGNEIENAPADLWFSHGGAVCRNCLHGKTPSYDSVFLQEIYQFSKGETSLSNTSYLRIENFFIRHLRTHTGTLENLKSREWLLETRDLDLN